MKRTPTDSYLEQAMLLSEEEAERLLSRMRRKLTRRLEDKELSVLECMAIQLEREDEELMEWRKNFSAIRESLEKSRA